MLRTRKKLLFLAMIILTTSSYIMLRVVNVVQSNDVQIDSGESLSSAVSMTPDSSHNKEITLPTPASPSTHAFSRFPFFDALMKTVSTAFHTISSMAQFAFIAIRHSPIVELLSNKTKPACPAHGVVYSIANGRLGNLMWDYLAVFVVAQRTGLKPFVHPTIRRVLDEVFVNLSVPARAMQLCSEAWNFESHGHLLSTPNASSIQIYGFYAPVFVGLVELIVEHQPDIRQEFTFHPHLVEHAQKVMRAAQSNADTVFIGIHVRRTDYDFYLRAMYLSAFANVSYYENAMDMYRRKYKEAVFVVVSDDIQWCRQHLSRNNTDVVFESGTVAEDMATMAACNHSIIDYGTYGEWGAMLAGGEAIVYNITDVHNVTAYLATLATKFNWTLIK